MYIFIEVWLSKEIARRHNVIGHIKKILVAHVTRTRISEMFYLLLCLMVLVMKSRTLISPHAQMQQGHVRMEKIRKERCLWKGESEKGMLIAYGWNLTTGAEVDVNFGVHRSTKQSLKRFWQTVPEAANHVWTSMITTSRLWVCWIALVCRLWRLLRQFHDIDQESSVSDIHMKTQRKSYVYAVDSFFCLFDWFTPLPLQCLLGNSWAIP